MKHLAYPFLDKRSLWITIAVAALGLLFVVFILSWVALCMWVAIHQETYQRTDEAPPAMILGLIMYFGFLITNVVIGIFYVGLLVATNREGWRRSNRLPNCHGDGCCATAWWPSSSPAWP